MTAGRGPGGTMHAHEMPQRPLTIGERLAVLLVGALELMVVGTAIIVFGFAYHELRARQIAARESAALLDGGGRAPARYEVRSAPDLVAPDVPARETRGLDVDHGAPGRIARDAMDAPAQYEARR